MDIPAKMNNNKVDRLDLNVACVVQARDYKGFGTSVQTGNGIIVCVAQRGRNPEHPTARDIRMPTEQRYEVCNQKNVANAITTVAKDCMALEIKKRSNDNGKD